ncbi:hypothetical protein LIER_24800 [Lithospermum erythrorhizon]|uniref:DUF4219 domain-containing protein n=1 Tax=Lithospermum erythrorhizon TaxID=34254 RepID=A0AAV3R5T0_LITER
MAGGEGIVRWIAKKFDGIEFCYWKMNMKYYLYEKELDALLGDKPDNYDDEAWKKLDSLVLGVIRPRLSRNVAANVAKVTTTKELMKAFCDEVHEAMVIAKGHESGTIYLADSSQKNISRVLVYKKKQTSFDIGVSMKIYRSVIGKIHVLNVLSGSREVLRSCANEAALKIKGSRIRGMERQKRNSLMSNRAWRFSKMLGKKAKAEHVDCLNEGKVQWGKGNDYFGISLVVKLVSFRDVLGLVNKVLKLGSASMGVCG